jgi:hypothetical protein
MRRRTGRGYSLIELAIATGILAALAVTGWAALQGLKSGTSYSTAMSELVVGLRRTRAEAFGRGNPTYFIVDTAGGRWWGVEDVGGDFTLDGFNPSNPAPAPDNLLASGTLPTGASFGPALGWNAALARPFGAIPSTTSAGANYAYCSFCRKSGVNTGFGAVQFQPGGVARFDAGPAALGQVFTVASSTKSPIKVTAVAMVARTGVVYTFEKTQ